MTTLICRLRAYSCSSEISLRSWPRTRIDPLSGSISPRMCRMVTVLPAPEGPRGREPRVRRLTLDEMRAVLAAAVGRRERRMAYLAACAGLRCSELRLLQGRHFEREGWILVSADMAKGRRERWVPVMVDLQPVVSEIRETTAVDHYVLPATQWV